MDEEDRPGTEADPAEREDVSDADERESAANEPGAVEPLGRDESSGADRFTGDGDGVERTRPSGAESSAAETESLIHRFRHDREGALMWIREMLSSVAIVLVIGLLLFGISGVWPPMVAVESGSMEPNMEVGDLVFVTEPGRLAPDAATNDIGVVTHEAGERADYRTFGSYGSVIIYRPPGRTASPIIHRAMFHVEEGENWYDRADEEYHNAAGCGELRNCPAPHSGFITLGDNNGAYDQANGLATPVRAEWVTGVARVRVPYLGYVRLIASGQVELRDVLATTAAADSVGVDGPETIGERGEVDGREVDGREEGGAREAVDRPTVSGGGSVASVAG